MLSEYVARIKFINDLFGALVGGGGILEDCCLRRLALIVLLLFPPPYPLPLLFSTLNLDLRGLLLFL
jgi:hypothetical protein